MPTSAFDQTQTNAKRIAPDKVQIDLAVQTKPNMDFLFYVDGALIQNMMSDGEGRIKETVVVSHTGNQSILVTLSNVIQGVNDEIMSELNVVDERIEALKSVSINGLNLSSPQCHAYIDDYEVVMTAVRQNGLALQFASPILRNNRDIVMEAMKQNGSAFEYTRFRNDYDIVMMAVKKCGSFLAGAKDLQNNYDIVMAAVKQDGTALHWASDSLKDNYDIVMAAVKQRNTFSAHTFKQASDRLKKDFSIFSVVLESKCRLPSRRCFHELIEEIYESKYKCPFRDFIYCVDDYTLGSSNEYNNNKFLVLLCVSWENNMEHRNRHARASYLKDIYSKISPNLQLDNDVLDMMILTLNNKELLKDVPVQVKKDEAFIMQCIQKFGYDQIQEYLPAETKKLPKVKPLKEASDAKLHLQFHNDMIRVTKNGMSLLSLSEGSKNNYDIVMAAVIQNGHSLQYASSKLKDNYNIVLTAITQDGSSFQYASNRLKNNLDMFNRAVEIFSSAYSDASGKLKQDYIYCVKNVTLIADGHDGTEFTDNKRLALHCLVSKNIYAQVSLRLQQDPDVLFAAMRYNENLFRRIPEALRNDESFVARCVKTYSELPYRHLSEYMKHLPEMKLILSQTK